MTQHRFWLSVLILAHTGLLAWSAYRHSPTIDEIAHLPSGIVIWKFDDYSLYRVNPPLVRMVAALPVLFVDHEEDWSRYRKDANYRLEWPVGRSFAIANGPRICWLITLARWICIPFSMLGLVVCYRWGSELFSRTAGLLAATLWAFSPNTIGHGSLITPDIAATSIGLLATWSFANWWEQGNWLNAFTAGIAMGLALLTKSYWICLFGVWPVLGVVCLLRSFRKESIWTNGAQLLIILVLGLNILNLGYGFIGTGKLLGEFDFYSKSLSGKIRKPGENLPGNRFAESRLGSIPIPLPADYVSGIDLQKLDFETGKWSYFYGETKDTGGWLHYYVVGLFLKVPIGVWGLFLMGFVHLLSRSEGRQVIIRLMPLLIPVLLLFVTASIQTGMNRHIRYVFPALPLIYLIGSALLQRLPKVAMFFAVIAIASSLTVYPHSLSFFNWSVGGPDRGHLFLIDSNLDWGQDMLYVQEWIDSHPDAKPIFVAWHGDIPISALGIPASNLPYKKDLDAGWYIISRHEQKHPRWIYKQFDRLAPVDQIGYTFDVYQIQSETKIE